MDKKKSKQNQKINATIYDKIKVEYLFLIIGLVFGLMLVFTNPPWQTNDEDRHFIHAYYLSQGYILPEQGDNKIGGIVPNSIYEVPAMFQGIRFSDETKISKSKLEEAENIKLNESVKQFYHNHHRDQNPVGFIPAALGILIGQSINDNPVWLGWWGRIGDLVFYLVIILFAIKMIPIFKNVLFLYALTPMCLYQGASVTYDAINVALTFLFFAVVIRYAVDESLKIGWKELILILLLLIIHRYSKHGYPLIPLAVFLIPKDRYNLPFNIIFLFIFYLIFSYILYKLPNYTWNVILSSQSYHLEKAQQLKKDLVGSYPANLELTLKNPGKFFTDMYHNLNHFRQEWLGGLLGRFGYSYTLLPDWFFLIHGLIIISVAALDNSKEYVVKTWQRYGSFSIGVGSILGIIVMSYFISPIGASQIFGLQGRYLINAVPFLLLVLYNNKTELKEWKKFGTIVLAGYIVLTLIYTVVYLDGVFYSTP